jgi:predicted nucleic acid-binding protein
MVDQKSISVRAARLHLHSMLSANLTVHSNDRLLKRAYVLAEQYALPSAYESQYLALAEQLSCDFWTTDKCLFDAASCGFPNIHWVGDWQPDD